MKKVVKVFTKQKFDDCLRDLSEKLDYFEYIVDGNTVSIKTKDRKYVYVDVGLISGGGFHISKLVRNNVLKRITEDPKLVVVDTNLYPTQLFNVDSIEKKYKEPCVAIDISNCYFSTIYKLGYIDRETYDRAMRKPEWKLGRNASVGSLAKRKFVYPYKNGVKDLLGKKVIESPDELKWVRNCVIGHVYRLFNQLRQEIGGDFLMWLTDCIYAPETRREQIENFFRDYGYRFKCEDIVFMKPNKEKKIIYWQNLTKSEIKWINYSLRQTI